MLLARIEQTDERLTITPMKSIGWDTVAAAAWLVLYVGVDVLAEFHRSFYGITLRPSFVPEFMTSLTALVGILVALIRSKGRYAFWQWPTRPFVFERSPYPTGRVALSIREQAYGSYGLRIMFVMSGLEERKIIETTSFSFARVFSHNPFSISRWQPYPSDRLPADAIEYEIVMLANLIHSYLGLTGPAPCKYSIPFPLPIANTR